MDKSWDFLVRFGTKQRIGCPNWSTHQIINVKKFATITVIGRDKTGVVARVTGMLFAQKANIEALEEQVTRGQFSMTVQASWKTKQLDQRAATAGLNRLARDLAMEIKIRFTEPNRRQRMALL